MAEVGTGLLEPGGRGRVLTPYGPGYLLGLMRVPLGLRWILLLVLLLVLDWCRGRLVGSGGKSLLVGVASVFRRWRVIAFLLLLLLLG